MSKNEKDESTIITPKKENINFNQEEIEIIIQRKKI